MEKTNLPKDTINLSNEKIEKIAFTNELINNSNKEKIDYECNENKKHNSSFIDKQWKWKRNNLKNNEKKSISGCSFESNKILVNSEYNTAKKVKSIKTNVTISSSENDIYNPLNKRFNEMERKTNKTISNSNHFITTSVNNGTSIGAEKRITKIKNCSLKENTIKIN